MPDERDPSRRDTPPSGARAASRSEWDEDTPVPGSPSTEAVGQFQELRRISRRVKVTARTALATLELAGELRREMDARTVQLDAKIAQLASDHAKLRESTARSDGKLDVLVEALDHERKSHQQYEDAAAASLRAGVEITKTRALTEIEVERSGAIASINETQLRTKYRRQLALKIVAVLAGAWGLVSTLALAHCGA